MLKRKHIVFVALALASCLLGSLFYNTITQAQVEPKPYDPWVDINDDGVLDIMDVLEIGIRFGEEGTPINKVIFKSGNVSVPAAAFVPQSSYVNMMNNGRSLHNDENVTELFFGSIQLSNGANVTNVTFYWWDQGNENMVCRLWRYNQTHNQEMAEMWSSGNPGYGSSQNDAVAFATVDNSQYAYFLEVGIPGESNGHGAYHFQYAVIEYEYPI